MKIEWRKVTTGICRSLANVPKGAIVDSIDDRGVLTQCEACTSFVFEGEEYVGGEDADLCSKCAAEMQEDYERRKALGELTEAELEWEREQLEAGSP